MMEQNKAATRTLSFLVITLSLYLIIWQVLAARFSLPVYYYARLIELLALGLFVALAIFTPMEFSEMGIIVPRPTLFRSLALGGGVALLAIGALAGLSAILGHAPLFSWRISGDISRATYFVVAPFQEILAKSVMYYSFELCFGRDRPWLACGMSALVFGAFHVVYGIRMMLLAMGLALLTGWIFQRERCVWGCALTHFAFGFFPLCFGFA